MQCERCGTEFPEDATSCVKCGAPRPAAATVRVNDPLVEAEATVMAEEIIVEEPALVSSPSGESTITSGGSGCGKTCLWGVLGCAGVSLVMMCLCLVISVVGVNLLPSQFPVPMEEILGLAEEMNQTGGELPWEEIFSLAEGMTLEDAGFPAEIDLVDLTTTRSARLAAKEPTELFDFEHPMNATYILGNTFYQRPSEHFAADHLLGITLDDLAIAEYSPLYGSQVVTLIWYDRNCGSELTAVGCQWPFSNMSVL